MTKQFLITGASTGIGYDAARLLIEQGHLVWGSVRKPADGQRVQQELGTQFTPLLFDVTDDDAIQQAAAQLKSDLNGRPLHGLVNNAGIAITGPMEHIPLREFRRQFDVNLFGVVAVTQAVLPFIAKPNGRIVNISSVSGKLTYPYFGPYAASKHALESMSDALRRELAIHGMHVSIIEPGSVITPIWGKMSEEQMVEDYKDTVYTRSLNKLLQGVKRTADMGMPVEIVSKTIAHALTADRPKIRYPLPNQWLMGWLFPRFLPQRWIDNVITKQLGLTPEKKL